MRTEVFFPSEATDDRKDEVRAAFRGAGVTISREGHPALKSLDIPDVRLDAAFIFAAGVFLEGLLFEAEKAALKSGIQALRAVWKVSGTVTIDTDTEPRQHIPTSYFVPPGDEGDAALAAIDEDYETGPTGQRIWLPGVGWRSMEELDRIQDAIDQTREEAGPESSA